MGNRYSSDNVAGDHIHTDITTCNIEEPHRSDSLKRSVIDYFGRGVGLNMFSWIKTLPSPLYAFYIELSSGLNLLKYFSFSFLAKILSQFIL